MQNFKFSIAMCVYKNDNPKWFEDALDSLYQSTLLPDEIVLVEDGPVPDTIEKVIKKFDGLKPSLNVVRLEKNVGFGNACQVCVEHSRNEWIARMDSDDICFPNRFEKQIKYILEHPDIDILGGATEHFQQSINEGTYKAEKPLTQEEIQKTLGSKCPFSHVTVMMRKKSVIDAGGYIEWFCEEDYYLWTRMILNGCKCANLEDALVYVRSLPEQMARRGGWKYFNSELVMQKYLLKNKLISPFRFFFNVAIRFGVEIICTQKMRYWIRCLLIWKK